MSISRRQASGQVDLINLCYHIASRDSHGISHTVHVYEVQRRRHHQPHISSLTAKCLMTTKT